MMLIAKKSDSLRTQPWKLGHVRLLDLRISFRHTRALERHMFTLWPLFLAQISLIVASGVSFEEDEIAPVHESWRGEETEWLLPKVEASVSSLSTSSSSQVGEGPGEKNLEEIESPVRLPSMPLSSKDQRWLAFMELEKKAKELKLLLSSRRNSEGRSGLYWDSKKAFYTDMARFSKEECGSANHVYTSRIEANKVKQWLVVPKNESVLSLWLQIDETRYTLAHGIARLFNQNGDYLSCRPFDVYKEEIVIDEFGCFLFDKADGDCFKYSPLKRSVSLLPSKITTADGVALSVEYDYGFYRNDGSLQSPFDIKKLSYLHDPLMVRELNALLYQEDRDEYVASHAISLIRFVQLWNAIQKEQSHFIDNKLELIRSNVEALKGDDVKEEREKIKTTWIMAYEFLHQHHEGHFDCVCPLLSILKAKEPTMKNARFLGEESPFYCEFEDDGATHKDPPEELLFYAPTKDSNEKFPLTAITCAGEEASIELIAVIDYYGIMYTFNMGSDHVNGDLIFQMAYSSAIMDYLVINAPIRGERSLPTGKHYSRLLYIFRFVNNRRFKATKKALK